MNVFTSGQWIVYTDETKATKRFDVQHYNHKFFYPVLLQEKSEKWEEKRIGEEALEIAVKHPNLFREATPEEIQEEKRNQSIKEGDWVIAREKCGMLSILDDERTANFARVKSTKEVFLKPQKILRIHTKDLDKIYLEDGSVHIILDWLSLRKATQTEVKKHKLQKTFHQIKK